MAGCADSAADGVEGADGGPECVLGRTTSFAKASSFAKATDDRSEVENDKCLVTNVRHELHELH